MKTFQALVSQLAKNHNQTSDLIKQLAEVQDNNKDVLDQLLNLDTSYLDATKSEEEDPSPGFLSGARAVVLSPDPKRRGLTGHVTTLSKSKLTADFRADNSKVTFPVRVSNLFKLKRKNNKNE